MTNEAPKNLPRVYLCVICYNPIPEDRAKRAIARGRTPKYDTDRCQSRGKIREAYKRFKDGAPR
jgi:hypothetical protein